MRMNKGLIALGIGGQLARPDWATLYSRPSPCAMCGCRLVAIARALVVRTGDFATGHRSSVCDPILSAHEITPPGAVLFSAYPSAIFR